MDRSEQIKVENERKERQNRAYEIFVELVESLNKVLNLNSPTTPQVHLIPINFGDGKFGVKVYECFEVNPLRIARYPITEIRNLNDLAGFLQSLQELEKSNF